MGAAHQLGKQDHQRLAEIKARGYWNVDIDRVYHNDQGSRGSGRQIDVVWWEPVPGKPAFKLRHQKFVGVTVGDAIKTAHKELKEVTR